MEEPKKDEPAAATPATPDAAASAGTPGTPPPADALAKPTDPNAVAAAAADETAGAKPAKKGGFKATFKKVNLYLLIFIFIVVIAGAVSIVSFLNSKKTPKVPAIATQSLTTDTLKQLANSDATVGGSGQTLTVQGNAIFSGQVLIRSDLNVAGTIKVGTGIVVPEITVSGKSNLSDTQINSLQVAQNTILQGSLTAQKDINVAGAASFSGPVTVGQITVTKLIMSGNASLQIPNHIAFTGASPARTLNTATLGNGGTASVNGSDTTGTVNINSGDNTTAGCFVTVTFAKVFTTAPHVLISPIGAAAGNLQYYVNRSTTSFSICTNNAAATGQVFGFDYFVTQ
jgi:cytoskeletal protein CcmA (bactofilin family)